MILGCLLVQSIKRGEPIAADLMFSVVVKIIKVIGDKV